MALSVLFAVFALIAIISGFMVVTARHPVKAVLSLIVAFVATSGNWMLLQAEFLSLVLVVVYVGAVMVLFLFVVMMLDVEKAEAKASFVVYWPFAGGLAILFFVLLMNLIGHMPLPQNTPDWDFNLSNITQVGLNLFTYDLYPFEIAALILLGAMIASIALTFRGRNPNSKAQKINQQLQANRKDRLKMVEMAVEKKPEAGILEPEVIATEEKPQ